MSDPALRASTAAVLDAMVAGITERKQAKAVTLTPVGTETARLPRIAAPFPNDNPQEVVEGAIREIDRQIVNLQEVVAALRAVAGKPQPDEQAPVKSQQQVEREADIKAANTESLADRMARLEREAQEAVFTATSERVTRATEVWECSTHGSEDIRQKTSPKGRTFDWCAIPNCKEFQR